MKISDLKNRLENLNNRGNKPRDLWKPTGKHEIRLLKGPKDEPFPSRGFHYNVGDVATILCPKANFAEECAICDFAETLRGWKDENGADKPEAVRKADFEIFKKIQVAEKVFTQMVERKLDENGKPTGEISEPKWWGLTQNMAKQVLEIMLDPERLEECGINPQDEERATDAVFSAKKAFDLSVSVIKANTPENPKPFPVTNIKAKFKTSALTGNDKKDAELVANIKPLTEVFPRVPSSEAELALRKFLASEPAEPKVEAGQEKYAGGGTESAKKVGGLSLEEGLKKMEQE